MTIRRVLFNDGEGADEADLNNIALFQREFLNNLILKGMCQDGIEFAVGLDTSKAYAHGHSGSVVSVEGLKTRTYSGLVFFWDGTDLLAFDPVGGAAGTFAHTFSTAGLTAGQSRWDLCCYKIEEVDADSDTRDAKDPDTGVIGSQEVYKEKDCSITVQFVEGTPDTTANAVEPSTPSGYAKLYAVRVDYGQTGVFQYDQMRDYRYPLGYHEQLVRPAEMFHAATGGWVYAGDEKDIWHGGGAADDIYIPYKGPTAARAIYLCVAGMPGSTCTCDLGYFTRTGQSTSTFTAIAEAITAFQCASSSERYYHISNNLALWGNGRQTPAGVTQCASQLMARIYTDDANGYIHQAKWGYCGF